MSVLDKEKVTVPCPGCRKPLNATVYDLYSRQKIRCSSCGSEYQITSGAASQMRSAMSNVERSLQKVEDTKKDAERAYESFNKAEANAVGTATLLVTRK